jgi:DNA-3-methyladenine glycosylase I
VRYADGKRRCAWCGDDPLYIAYHDLEWGRPLRDDSRLFELLCLEGAQAGLSWITVLRKRERYRTVFDDFDAAKIARYDARDRRRLLADPGIIRNRLKVNAFIENAKAYLRICEQEGGFADFIWKFAGGRIERRRPLRLGDGRSVSPRSEAMSKELTRRGFKFVGSTICYAYMQASGMVDEHQRNCWVAKSTVEDP